MISDIGDPATPLRRELLDCGCRAEYGLTALAWSPSRGRDELDLDLELL